MSANKLPNVSSRFGAPMGRSGNITDPDFPVKFRMTNMPFVDYDYDEGGAYWGYVSGTRMYWVRGDGEDEQQEMFVRATSRDDAKKQVLEEFPFGRFFQ